MLQTGLMAAGFIPGIGDVANGINAVISLARGNYGEAALYALAAIPIAGVIGEAAIAAKETEAAVEGVQLARSLGEEGEAAVREAYDIGEKARIEVNGGYRFPDGLNSEAVSEVKNVEYQSFTRQLRDYSDFAQQNKLRFDLYVRPDTILSGPLQDAVDSGLINRLAIPR